MLMRKAAIIIQALLIACVAALAGSQQLAGQASSVLGNWTEPTGSVIHVDHCGINICFWIISVSNQARATTDIYNPNPALRSRRLCGLQIGSGFTLQDSAHAINGTLYDPKTGKTYHGQLTAQGSLLYLRGYIGVPLFGRTQNWTRAAVPPHPCASE